MSSSEKWLKFILRFNGYLAVGAVFAVLMPQSWLVWCVSNVEPGFQVGLLVSYLARALSMFFVLTGLFMIEFAKDVKRYKRAIRVIPIWCLFAISSFGIYASINLGYVVKHWFFWAVMIDGLYSLIFIAAIVILQSKMETLESSTQKTNMGLD